MTQDGTVRRRRVFYIPGYDPIHPRRYRELYRKEGAAQASRSGYELILRPKPGGGTSAYGWYVDGRIEGAETEATIEVLYWSDIVRASMDRGIAATYAALFRTAWIYISTGALRRLMWLRKGPVIAALYPVVMLLLQALVAILSGALAGWGFARGLAILLPVPTWLATVLGLIVAGAVALALLRWFKAKDGKIFAYYLMHDYAYSALSRGANPPELEARMAEFGAAIAEALASGTDEVLVVGHSSGAHLGVSILADLIRRGLVPRDGPALSFLSLGQVVPMVAFLPDAWRLRADLAYLSTRDELYWLDVTAPGDGCAFALCDPVAVCGVAPPGKRHPLVISAAFSQTLRPETWAKLKRRYFRLHFQYLCAFDNLPGQPWDYDYFRITAGPKTLQARFTGRPPSKSRIETPASPYTSTRRP